MMRLLVVALAVPLGILAAELPTGDTVASASRAFALYTASHEQTSAWDLETVEIDASLPKLEKQGRLRAIRRLLPFGHPQYQVLGYEGDPTVKQQVIVRYLSADAQASLVSDSSAAITPANYKFRYKGPAEMLGHTTYVFQITPRRKRQGLIKGELWLDAETGTAVRQSGYLVKRPSWFLKHVAITRETILRNGVAVERVTHLSVDARFFGRAELVIEESPSTAADGSSLSVEAR